LNHSPSRNASIKFVHPDSSRFRFPADLHLPPRGNPWTLAGYRQQSVVRRGALRPPHRARPAVPVNAGYKGSLFARPPPTEPHVVPTSMSRIVRRRTPYRCPSSTCPAPAASASRIATTSLAVSLARPFRSPAFSTSIAWASRLFARKTGYPPVFRTHLS